MFLLLIPVAIAADLCHATGDVLSRFVRRYS